MDKIILNAFAKINLSLDILNLREDNYHEVAMLMQTIALKDTLTFYRSDEFEFTCSEQSLAVDENNLVIKAYNLLKKKYNIQKEAKIELQKDIPIAAGLAGGSTDAGATLLGLNLLWELNLSIGKIADLAKEIGSDVPFTVIGGTVLALGRGEKLTILPALEEQWLVLVNPGFPVKTKDVYNKWDSFRITKEFVETATKKMLDYLEEENFQQEAFLALLANDLEPVTTGLYPELEQLRGELLETGAIKVVMSGSGPTFLGFYRDQESGAAAFRELRGKYKQVYLTRFV